MVLKSNGKSSLGGKACSGSGDWQCAGILHSVQNDTLKQKQGPELQQTPEQQQKQGPELPQDKGPELQQRQANREGRSGAGLAFGGERAAVGFGDPAADGKTQAGASGLARARFVGTIETLEDVFEIGGARCRFRCRQPRGWQSRSRRRG